MSRSKPPPLERLKDDDAIEYMSWDLLPGGEGRAAAVTPHPFKECTNGYAHRAIVVGRVCGGFLTFNFLENTNSAPEKEISPTSIKDTVGFGALNDVAPTPKKVSHSKDADINRFLDNYVDWSRFDLLCCGGDDDAFFVHWGEKLVSSPAIQRHSTPETAAALKAPEDLLPVTNRRKEVMSTGNEIDDEPHNDSATEFAASSGDNRITQPKFITPCTNVFYSGRGTGEDGTGGTTKKRGLWACRRALDYGSCNDDIAIDLIRLPSTTTSETESTFVTPKRNRDTGTTLQLVENMRTDENSVDGELSEMKYVLCNGSLALEDGKIYVSGFIDSDVLCGRGETINRHPGNVLFHEAKKVLQPRYLQTGIKRKVKTAIAQELVNVMRCDHGSRFLAQDEADGLWYFVDETRVLEKAKQALREDFTAEQRQAKRQRYSAHNGQSNQL